MRPIPAVSAVCAVLAAGCGGDGEGPGRRQKPVTARPGSPLHVVAREYSFRPADIVVSKAGGGATVRFVLSNEGALAHNLKVFGEDGRDLGGTPTFPGGETRSGSVRLARGSYRLICTVGDHAELGMTGTLVVR